MKRILIVLFILGSVFFVFQKKSLSDTYLQEESKKLVDAVERGEKVTHFGVTVDVPKLKEVQTSNDILKNFEIVFEGDKVGLKFREEAKKGGFFSSAKPEKSYMVLMPRQNFEIFLASMFQKEEEKYQKEGGKYDLTQKKSEDPSEWEFKNVYPEFFVVDEKGNRTVMTEKDDAKEMYEKLVDAFCEMNNECVVNVGEIISGYEKEIKEHGGKIGIVLLKIISSSTTIQNAAIKLKVAPDFKDKFYNLALTSDQMRQCALDNFNKEKEKAIKKYQEDRDPVKLAQREEERLRNLLTIDKLDSVKSIYENHITFLCEDKEVDIYESRNGQFSYAMIRYTIKHPQYGKLDTGKEVQPEEWAQIVPLLEKSLTVQVTTVQTEQNVLDEYPDEESEGFWMSLCAVDEMKNSEVCRAFQKLWQKKHCLVHSALCPILKTKNRLIYADKLCGRGKRVLTTKKMEDEYKDAQKMYGRFCCSLDWDFSDLFDGTSCRKN